MKITMETTVGDILKADDRLVPVVLEVGVHSLDSEAVQKSTLSEICSIYGTDPERIAAKMNALLEHSA